jgi:hypothetical protein
MEVLKRPAKNTGQKFELQRLRDSLNPFTEFNMGITADQLVTAPKWRIQ